MAPVPAVDSGSRQRNRRRVPRETWHREAVLPVVEPSAVVFHVKRGAPPACGRASSCGRPFPRRRLRVGENENAGPSAYPHATLVAAPVSRSSATHRRTRHGRGHPSRRNTGHLLSSERVCAHASCSQRIGELGGRSSSVETDGARALPCGECARPALRSGPRRWPRGLCAGVLPRDASTCAADRDRRAP